MECTEHNLEDSFSDSDDSYIEIELEDSISNLNLIQTEEYELRISISSTIQVPQYLQQGLDDEFSHAETSAAHPSPSSLLISNTTSTDNSGTFTDSPFTHSTLTHSTDQPRSVVLLDTYQNMDLRYTTSSTRKQGSMRIRNGGMMKLLIKLRAIKLGTLLASLVKARDAPCRQDKKASRSSKCRTCMLQCCEKSMVINPWGSEDERSCSTSSVVKSAGEARKSKHWDLDSHKRCLHSSSSSMVEITDLGALRGIFSALGIAQRLRSSKRKSCSTSCETSPIHQAFSLSSSDDNSIQAAIAYCKTSFGQT